MSTDYKCTLTLCDISTQDDNEGIDLIIFRKEAEMPRVDAGDVVTVLMARFQIYQGTFSLLTSFRTDIHVYEAQRVPYCKRSGSARGALREPAKKVSREPNAKEHEYVLWLFDRIDKSIIPDQQHFQDRAGHSLNVKDKFSLLQDVREGKFADLTVQVVKEPFQFGDNVSLWISDYTENSSFFHKTNDSADWTDGVPIRDGDAYGYTNNRKKPLAPLNDEGNTWSGPLGKRSLQLTCWEPHATFIRENVHRGDWVRLRNVQIRVGHNFMNLEGCLREDREYRDRVYVDMLEVAEDGETSEPRIKEIIRRKWAYEKESKQFNKNGEKRQAEEAPKKENNKNKRKKKLKDQQKALEEEAAKQEAALGLNEVVVTENQDKEIVPLSTILQPVYYTTSIGNQEVKLEMPFTCAKYRSNVRVVDFHPVSLKDFAVGRIPTEYDFISDHEDSDSDSTSSRSSFQSQTQAHSRHVNVSKRRMWEWRFALKLQEVSPTIKNKAPAQTWVIVNNSDAQLLLDLDATDLHSPESVSQLNSLRERLFRLWGNLEERKTRLETKKLQHFRDPLNAPPAGWSDDEDNGADASRVHAGVGEEDVPGSQLSNRPFTCCIRQYGVLAKAEEDGEEATAGEGRKWKRMFGLFGTQIKDE